MANCPECSAQLDVDEEELEEGAKLECPDCGTGLEVVSTNPVELNAVLDEEEEEDW